MENCTVASRIQACNEFLQIFDRAVWSVLFFILISGVVDIRIRAGLLCEPPAHWESVESLTREYTNPVEKLV